MGMRGLMSELDCLPVSAMTHIPNAQEALNPEGAWTADPESWDGYVGRALAQMEWWAEAARRQRTEGDAAATATFARDPSQRNAP